MIDELDSVIASVGMSVRAETLTEAWDLRTTAAPTPALPGGQVLLIVTMHARPGRGPRLEHAWREFAEATAGLAGSLGSYLVRSPEANTWHLVERFEGEGALGRHMASDYFRRFQLEQQVLLAGPVEAVFLQR
jgi:quinol monooxygenase YgiN